MDDNEDWAPKTALGRMVKAGEITNMKDVFNSSLPLIESNIVDALLPDLEEEVIDISLVQRMHKSGRRVRFRATVAIGNKNGYIGIGKAVAKKVGPAIRKSIRVAKLNITEISRGCGSWECTCGKEHSLPFKVTGRSGSVKVTLMPAPRGLGLAIGEVSKKILKLAGVRDVWSRTSGKTQTTVNTAKSTFDAIKSTSRMKLTDKQAAVFSAKKRESEVKE